MIVACTRNRKRSSANPHSPLTVRTVVPVYSLTKVTTLLLCHLFAKMILNIQECEGLNAHGDDVMEQVGYPSQGIRSSSEPTFVLQVNLIHSNTRLSSHLNCLIPLITVVPMNQMVLLISASVIPSSDHDLKSEEDTYSRGRALRSNGHDSQFHLRCAAAFFI